MANSDNLIALFENKQMPFELGNNQTLFYCYKIDLHKNPSGIMKVKLERLYGKTELSLSDFISKPNKNSAQLVSDVRKYIK